MSASAFAAALAFVLSREGGYVNDPNDNGGPTCCGITQKTLTGARKMFPHLRGVLPVDVKDITEAGAAEIYKLGYWQPTHCDDLPAGVSLAVFDAAVQHGPRQAIKFLQMALGATADGVFGNRTAMAVRRTVDWAPVLAEYTARRMRYYMTLADTVHFGLGWSRRLVACHDAARTAMFAERGAP